MRRRSFSTFLCASLTALAGVLTFAAGQANAQGCTYSVSPTNNTIDHLSQSVYFDVTTQAGCVWDAPLDPGGFLTRVGPGTGTGSGTIAYWAAPNGPSARSANFTLATRSVTVTQAASGSMTVSVTSNPSSPQPTGTSITFTAAVSGGTQHLDYRWWVSNGGGSWSMVQDWTYNVPTRVWTPPSASSSYFIVVNVRSSDNPSNRADGFMKFVATASGSVTSVTLASDRPSPQVTGAPIRWTATPSGGTSPLSYKWLLSTNGWASSTVLQDWTANANTYVWTPSAPGTQYQVGVWVRSAGNSNNAAEASASSPLYVVTASMADVLVWDTFTGTNGTLLSAHPPDINGTGTNWTITGNTPAPQLSGGRAVIGPGPGHLQATINAGTPDIRMAMDVRIGGTPYLAGLALRLTDADNHLVLIAYLGELQLYRKQAGTYTLLVGQPIPTVAVGSNHRLEARANGSTIEGWWDGALVVTTTSTFQQTATRHGPDWASHYDPAVSYDNFELRPAVAPSQPNVAFAGASLDQTITVPNGWGGNLSFSAAAFDTRGFWSSASPTRLSVPTGVSYVQVAASIDLPTTCTVCKIYVLKNDAMIVGESYGSTANNSVFGGATFTAVAPALRVRPGDFFTARVYHNIGASASRRVRFSIRGLDAGATGANPIKAASIDQTVSVPNGSGGDLTFSSALFDTAGLWTIAAPTRLTAPAGVSYAQVIASIDLPPECTVCQIHIRKNDAVTVATSYAASANTGLGGASFTAIAPVVRVAPADFFTVRVYQNTGAAVTAPVRFSLYGLDVSATSPQPFNTAHLEQSVSVAQAWSSPLTFSAASFDTAGFWSAAAPTRLTVPAGVNYAQVAASIDLPSTCNLCQIYIEKSGGPRVATSYGATANTGLGGATFTAIAPVLSVVAGDYFTVRTYQNSGAAVTVPVRFSITTFPATSNGVTSVSLSSNRSSPQPTGTAITWTAIPVGGTAPLSYKWRLSNDGGTTWSVLQNWTANASTYVWTPSAVGSQYRVGVWVRSAGNSNDSPEASAAAAYVVTPPSVTGVSVYPDRLPPQVVGREIRWTAMAGGGSAPLSYKWRLSTNGGTTWTVLQDWTPNATLYFWTPSQVSDQFRMGVWVRSGWNTNDAPEAEGTREYSTVASPPAGTITDLTLTADRPTPRVVGRTVTWTATPIGGAQPYSYKWWLTDNGGGSWTVLQDWTTNASTRTWTPQTPGDRYWVGVWVRSNGNTNNYYEQAAYEPFSVTATPQPTVLVYDTFTAANGAPLGARTPEIAPSGMTWSVQGSALSVQGNKVTATTGSGYVFATVDAGTADGIVAADVIQGATPAWGGLALRMVDSSNFLLVRYHAPVLTLIRVQGGVPTNLGESSPGAAAAGSRHRIEARLTGPAFDVYWDGVLQFNATSSFQQTATQHGLVWHPTTDVTALDTFELRAPAGRPVLTAPANQATYAATPASASIVATDPERDPLTYGATGLPPGLSVNTSTGAITGTPPAGSVGTYTVTASASDGALTGTRVFTWTVVPLPPPPAPPTSANPTNNAVGVSRNPTLTWSASGATSYDVRFGTSNPPPAVASSIGSASYAPAGTLAYGTTYYWQIVARNLGGATTGPVWSFTTETIPPDLFVVDSFTGADGTPLTAHPADVNTTGGVWTITGETPAPQLSGNQVGIAAGSGYLQATINSGVSDIRMTVDARIGSSPYLAALVFRLTDANNHLLLLANDGLLQFYRKQGGTYLLLARALIPTPAAGSTHRLELRAHGWALEGWWDNSLVVRTTTGFQQTATRHGLSWNSTYDVGTTYDNFEMRTTSSSTPTPPPSARVFDTFTPNSGGSQTLTSHVPDIVPSGAPWRLLEGTSATVAGTVGSPSGSRYVIATIDSGAANAIVAADFRSTSNTPVAGLVLRAADPENMLVLRYVGDTANGRLELARRVNGTFTAITYVSVGPLDGPVHRLEARLSGMSITGVWDGWPLFEVTINDNQWSTHHGLFWDQNYDGGAVVDNFKVTTESFTNPFPNGTNCEAQLSRRAVQAENGASTVTIDVTVPNGCAWYTRLLSGSDFTRVETPDLHLNSDWTQFALFNNNHEAHPRIAYGIVAGQLVTIVQAGWDLGECQYSIQGELDFQAAGGTVMVNVTPLTPGCTWSVSSTREWIFVPDGRVRSGPGSFTVTVPHHGGTATRNGYLWVGPVEVAVEQAAENCPITLSAYAYNAPASGDSTTITVNAPNGCGWQAVPNRPDMMEVNENPTGSGTMPIRIHVYNNPAGNPARSGYVDVWHAPFPPQRIQVTQDGVGTTAGEVLYYHTDAIGSVRMITDANQQVKARYDYLPFGEEFSPGAFRDPRLFTGAIRDEEIEADYLWARHYKNRIGRFLRPDDAIFADPANPQTWNLYAYGLNNPLRYVDPTGHQTSCLPTDESTPCLEQFAARTEYERLRAWLDNLRWRQWIERAREIPKRIDVRLRESAARWSDTGACSADTSGGNVAYVASGIFPLVGGVAGPAISLAYVPERGEFIPAFGIGASLGRNWSIGPVYGPNPSAVLRGLSWAGGLQFAPPVGGQVINSPGVGSLIGPTIGVPGSAGSATYGVCFQVSRP
jgi:RHS repeat-associated protein